MTTQQILDCMERIAPPTLAESWDNVGLLVDCGKPVTRVLVTLDILPEVVEEAVERGCDLIVSHHPVIFSPLKRVTPQDVPFRLAQTGISAICMHTNLDAAEGGVNDTLADLFGIRERIPFAGGCGRVGTIEPLTVGELARKAKTVLSPLCNPPQEGETVQVRYADAGKPVRRLAVISGAGGSLFEEALAQGADCLLTGEAGHHHACDALRLGMSLVVCGHYATEFPVTAVVAQRLKLECPTLEIMVSTKNHAPYCYL